MNENNNYKFDPMTGQPIQPVNEQQPVQTIVEQQTVQSSNVQPVQSTINQQSVSNQQPIQKDNKSKNSNIIIIFIIIGVVGLIGVLGVFAIVASIFLNFNTKQVIPNNDNYINDTEEVLDDNYYEEDNEVELDESDYDFSVKPLIGTVDKDTVLTYDNSGAFLFTIEDVFSITDRGTVASGKVNRGTVKVGDVVQIIGFNDEIRTSKVLSVEAFRKYLDSAETGDNVGILLEGVTREEVLAGQVLAKPNSIVAAKKFDADVHILSKEEGGRHTPFLNGYISSFYFRSEEVVGKVKLPNKVEMVTPGDDVSFTVILDNYMAMEVGNEFSIREGTRTVGKGKVTKIY